MSTVTTELNAIAESVIGVEALVDAIDRLQSFIPAGQLLTMMEGCVGEEGNYFEQKIIEFDKRTQAMPLTYEQDGKGDDAMVYLHYFKGAGDWYITEKDIGAVDKNADQRQAFGYADLGMGCPELGYISIAELVDCGIELDLHFQPTTLGQVKRARGDA